LWVTGRDTGYDGPLTCIIPICVTLTVPYAGWIDIVPLFIVLALEPGRTKSPTSIVRITVGIEGVIA
jgi:hypothetical protein